MPPVTLYGPAGLREYVESSLRCSFTHLGHEVNIEVVRPGEIYRDEEYEVVAAPLKHRIESYGYAVIEKEQTGRFKAEKAREMGIPPGPLYGRLKSGEQIELPDGRIINGLDLVGPPRPGRKFAYCSDTIFTPAAVELARNSDLLIHEATYTQEDEDLAVRGMHSTSVMAARVAKEAGVKTLILTHFSPRYEAEDGTGLSTLLQEARAIFPDSLMAEDFWSYDITRASM